MIIFWLKKAGINLTITVICSPDDVVPFTQGKGVLEFCARLAFGYLQGFIFAVSSGVAVKSLDLQLGCI